MVLEIQSCPRRTEEEAEALGTSVAGPRTHSKSVQNREDHQTGALSFTNLSPLCLI